MTGGFAVGRERAFAEVGRISAAGLDGPELLRRTAKALRRAVPFDAFCASTLDPATNLLTHGIAEGMDEGSGVEAGTFFDHVYFEEDLHQTRAMVREGRPVQLLSRSTGGKLDRSLRYRELLRPLGFAHELGSVFADGGAWGGMDLIRGADVPDFTAREVALVRRIAPHVGAGLKAAALRSRADARRGNPEAPGVLNLDREGSIASLTPAAERWLGDLEDLHPGWRAGPAPIPVRMVAGALTRSLDPAPGGDHDLIPRVRVRGRSGRWISLYASRAESSDGRPGGTVVVIEPARPEDVAWLNVASYGLTPREEEVVGLVARGRTTHEISAEIFVSEHTVQRHIQNAFEKVGVRTRGELVKRLFFENLLPGMLGG
ncbi:MAG TPA: LuxR C-terminal-related transcriptional regulator [Rubrobacter sp.]|nr:LuxR C-terminal-related transcriptional regulator [Rubrobacter sp.]